MQKFSHISLCLYCRRVICYVSILFFPLSPSLTSVLIAVNAAYNMGSHIQVLGIQNSKYKGISKYKGFQNSKYKGIHILGHFSSSLVLWHFLIMIKFINDPYDLVLYLISLSLRSTVITLHCASLQGSLTWFPSSSPRGASSWSSCLLLTA